jgi:DNA adenine methylase
MITRVWNDARFHMLTREHFYHVGSTEDLRHPMIEALILNFPASSKSYEREPQEQMAFFERPPGKFGTTTQDIHTSQRNHHK